MLMAHPISSSMERNVMTHFQAEKLMNDLGAQLVALQPGHVTIELPFSTALTEQNGVFHAGKVTNLIDAVCGCAAYSQTDSGTAMRTVAYKVNIVNRMAGDKLVLHGRVLRAGRKVTMCHGEALVYQNGQEHVYATMLVTLMPED